MSLLYQIASEENMMAAWKRVAENRGGAGVDGVTCELFAVNVLRNWYRNGENVQAKLPLLSTYMGHVSIDSTYYYLTFIEGIRSEASSRFYHHYGKELNIDDVESSILQNKQEINHAPKIHE